MTSLLAHSLISVNYPLFLEKQSEELIHQTSATLSTLCPQHLWLVIWQQGQDTSSDRCLYVLTVLTRSNLSKGFYFTE